MAKFGSFFFSWKHQKDDQKRKKSAQTGQRNWTENIGRPIYLIELPSVSAACRWNAALSGEKEPPVSLDGGRR
jgi:hypothetical protein